MSRKQRLTPRPSITMLYPLFLVLLLVPQEPVHSEPVQDDSVLHRPSEMELISEIFTYIPPVPTPEPEPKFTGRSFWGNVVGTSQQEQEAETPKAVAQPVPPPVLVPRTEVQILTGHTGPVEAIAFSPDFRQLFSGGSDRQIIRWDVLTGEPLRRHRGSRTVVASLAVSKNGKSFVSCTSTDRRVLFWNIDVEAPQEELPTPPFEPNAVAINSNATQMIVGLMDGQISFYRKNEDSPAFLETTIQGHLMAINHIRFSSNETSFLTCGNENTVIVWDTVTRKPIQTFRKHRSAVLCADFSPDGQKVVSAGKDKTALVWTIADGEIKHRLPGHVGDITAVAFSADGSEVFTAARDRTIVLWDTETGEKKAVAPMRNSPVLTAGWNEINKSIAIGCTNGTVEILAHSVFIPEKSVTDESSNGLFSTIRSRFSSLSEGDIQKRQALLELPRGQVVFRYGRTSHYSDIGTISPNGLQFASIATSRGEGALWETDTGKVSRLLEVPQQVSAIRFHTRDSNFLFLGLKNGAIRYWNLTQDVTSDLPGHEGSVQAIAVAPNGTQFLSATADGTIIFWDMLTKQAIQTIPTDKKRIRSLAFSPDGKHFAVGAADSVIGLWTLADGGNSFTEQKLTGHDTGDISVVFSPDGAYLYSAASDGRVIQWDAAAGRFLKEFKAHTDGILSIAVSPNGQYLLTGGKSEEFSLLWDVNTAEPVMVLPFQGGPVTDVMFHPKNLEVITVGGRTPLLWNISGIR